MRDEELTSFFVFLWIGDNKAASFSEAALLLQQIQLVGEYNDFLHLNSNFFNMLAV